MIAICTYSLGQCGASKVIDVVSNHQFALIRREGKWVIIESSDRKQAEESLRESEEKYRNLLESISDVVYTIDSSGVLTYISPVVKNTLGYEPDELIGRQFLEFVHKEDHDLLMRRFSELREGIIRHSDYRVIGKHGDIKWVRTLTNPIIEEGGFAGARGVLIDITERKQAEEALKKSEERFRTSVETLLEGFAILSAVRDSNGQLIDFKYEYINEAGCKMNQKPHEEHMGKTLLELLPTHKEIGLFDEYVRVVETGQSLAKEFLIYETVYGSGERLRQAFDVRITRLGDGFVTTWQDITDKKKGDELLRQSEERLRLLIENSKDVVIMADLEGNITYYNGPPEYGITAEEALGKNPFSIFEPVIAARLMNQLKLVMKGGEALTFENVIPWRGESFWFLNQMYPIRDEKGRMIAVGLIARNITERKQAEEALRRAEENFHRSLDDSPLGVRIVSANGETLYANRAILDIYGYDSIEELRTTPVKKRYTPESYAEFQIRKKKRQRGEYDPPEYEISIVRENGEVRHLQVFRKEVLWNGEKQYQVIYRDITERKQAEERILTYQDQLHSLMTELSLIEERERRHIATELHDNISQTLAITKIKLGMAQGLTSSTDWVGSLNEIGELIDQAVQYTRSLTFELSPPILYELGLEAAAEWLTEQIQEKHGIQIGFEDDRQSKPIKDEIRLSLFKATKELLINIVKHAQASKAKVSIWREDNSIRIRVEDDGVGFSASKDKQLGKTTGFGLFNIRERIKYLRGNIEIKSEPGGGTQITLSAPLEEKED
jgi:PAS domain S-box-containing protein